MLLFFLELLRDQAGLMLDMFHSQSYCLRLHHTQLYFEMFPINGYLLLDQFLDLAIEAFFYFFQLQFQ